MFCFCLSGNDQSAVTKTPNLFSSMQIKARQKQMKSEMTQEKEPGLFIDSVI